MSGISIHSNEVLENKDSPIEDNKKEIDSMDNDEEIDSLMSEEPLKMSIISFDKINVSTDGEGDNVRNCKTDILSTFNKMKGRREVGTYNNDNIFINHTRHHVPKKLHVADYEVQLKEPDFFGPPRIRAVWLNQLQNMEVHNTTAYATTGIHNNSSSVKQLVLRRGIPFCIDFSFDQPLDIKKHSLTIILQFGQTNVCSSPSMICLKVNDGLKPNSWSAGFPKKIFHSARQARHRAEEESKGKNDEEKKKQAERANILNANKIQIQINCPSNAVLGKCMLTFDTALLSDSSKLLQDSVSSIETDAKKNKEKETMIMRNFHNEPIYILCNPWKKEDQTYMSDPKDLQEYVENEIGWIYVGTHKQLKALQWNFDQYNNTTLNSALYILDVASLSVDVRNDVSLIVRAISKYVTALDGSGILEGNWSGNYSPEIGPAQWLGSLPILERFMTSKKPVGYAHCYVLAAVATSLCRCLGIPSRCVTNYISAHDCDGNKKVNLHWGSVGQPIDVLNTTNFWTFHVWCEAYMKRPDLPLNSYGGWQAFDPTPQESTFGVCCAGPCPVEAIKQGDLNSLYDCRLLFSEIHAHHFHWIVMDNGNWRVVMQPRRAGDKMLTHDPSPKKITEKDLCLPAAEEIKIEAISIKDNYKYKEGLVLERVSMERADTNAINSDVFDLGEGDINFSVCQGDLEAGKIIGVSLVMQNTGTVERIIDITLSLYSSYYTGISKRKIKAMSYTVTLGPLSKEKVTLRATVEQYCWYTADYYNFKTYAMARVHLTDQVFCTCEDFCLDFPDIEFELSSDKVIVDHKTTIKLKWFNPLPIDLKNCMWTVQGHNLMPFTLFPATDIEPLSSAELEIFVKPTEIKDITLLANFSSDQTPFARGRLSFSVIEELEKKSTWNVV